MDSETEDSETRCNGMEHAGTTNERCKIVESRGGLDWTDFRFQWCIVSNGSGSDRRTHDSSDGKHVANQAARNLRFEPFYIKPCLVSWMSN
jgi:hypothetical protein